MLHQVAQLTYRYALVLIAVFDDSVALLAALF